MSELRVDKIFKESGKATGAYGGVVATYFAGKTDAEIMNGGNAFTALQSYPIKNLSFTVTPQSASNAILLMGMISNYVDSSQQAMFFIERDGVVVSPVGDADGARRSTFVTAQGNEDYYGSWVVKNTPFFMVDTPATTSPVTYQVVMTAEAKTNTVRINMSERDQASTGYDARTCSCLIGMELSG